MAVEPHQQRVLDEHKELTLRLTKLTAFIGGPTFTGLKADEQERLYRQRLIMREYQAVLDQRIAAWENP